MADFCALRGVEGGCHRCFFLLASMILRKRYSSSGSPWCLRLRVLIMLLASLDLAAGDGMEGVRADAVHVGFEQAGEPGEVPVAGSMADAGRVFDQFAHRGG